MGVDGAATYSIELANDSGKVVLPLNTHFGFQYGKTVNGAGWFTLPIPVIDNRYLEVDNIIKIWRRPEGGNPQVDFVGFLRRWALSTTQDGQTTLTLGGPDQNDLIDRRIIAWAAGTPQAVATTYVDDEMKRIVKESLGADAGAARDLSALQFTIEPNKSLGPIVEKNFAWRKVSRVLSDLNKAAETAGTEVFWFIDVVGIDTAGLPIMQFKTAINYPGNNRTWAATATTQQPLLFGLSYGNLQSPRLEFDYSNEANYAYGGGQGEGEDRLIVEVSDSDRINASIWNRRELFVDARNQDQADAITAVANEKIALHKPQVRFSGTILSNEQTPYGSWGLGDLATVEYEGFEFNAVIRNVTVNVDLNGNEHVWSRMGYEGAAN